MNSSVKALLVFCEGPHDAAFVKMDMDHAETRRAVAEIERFKKAVLTTVGQRKKPGGSLNVVLEQADLISDDALRACLITAGFVEFIREFWGMID